MLCLWASGNLNLAETSQQHITLEKGVYGIWLYLLSVDWSKTHVGSVPRSALGVVEAWLPSSVYALCEALICMDSWVV
jgi:hypothetical protein